jgi:hypothetical protein
MRLRIAGILGTALIASCGSPGGSPAATETTQPPYISPEPTVPAATPTPSDRRARDILALHDRAVSAAASYSPPAWDPDTAPPGVATESATLTGRRLTTPR